MSFKAFYESWLGAKVKRHKDIDRLVSHEKHIDGRRVSVVMTRGKRSLMDKIRRKKHNYEVTFGVDGNLSHADSDVHPHTGMKIMKHVGDKVKQFARHYPDADIGTTATDSDEEHRDKKRAVYNRFFKKLGRGHSD